MHSYHRILLLSIAVQVFSDFERLFLLSTRSRHCVICKNWLDAAAPNKQSDSLLHFPLDTSLKVLYF